MALILVALAGCVPSRLDPEGDYPDAGAGNVRAPDTVQSVSGMGVLWVRTEEEHRTLSDDPLDPKFPTAYWVYNDAGDVVAERVLTTATLAPGRYFVWQETAPDFPRTFQVTLHAGEVSAVDPRLLR